MSRIRSIELTNVTLLENCDDKAGSGILAYELLDHGLSRIRLAEKIHIRGPLPAAQVAHQVIQMDTVILEMFLHSLL